MTRQCSLPYRQLRKQLSTNIARCPGSLPYRQLRKLTDFVTVKAGSSLPYRQLRKSWITN